MTSGSLSNCPLGAIAPNPVSRSDLHGTSRHRFSKSDLNDGNSTSDGLYELESYLYNLASHNRNSDSGINSTDLSKLSTRIALKMTNSRSVISIEQSKASLVAEINLLQKLEYQIIPTITDVKQ